MPKEQTHWILAAKAAQALEDGGIKAVLARHPNLYMLGAVIPDTPMYALQRTEQYGVLAGKLHGKSGENTFAPLSRLLALYEGRWSGGMWAFVLGAMAHILADAVFHPWVEYFTGSSTDVPPSLRLLSLARHRELESYLDLYHLRKNPGFKPRTFWGILKNKEMQARDFEKMVAALFFNSHDPEPGEIRKLLMAHGALQWIFMQKSLARAAFAVNDLLNRKGDAWVTLFYPDREPEPPRYFGKGIAYRHTVTGRPKEGRTADLTRKTVRVTARMFALVEKHMEQDTVLDFFQRIKGPSLETGLAGVPASRVIHYDLEKSMDEILGRKRARA